MLSGGYLSKAVLLAVAVGNESVRCQTDLERLRFVRSDEREELVALCRTIGLLAKGDNFRLCEIGKLVVESYSKSHSCEKPFRILLASYIQALNPPWAWRIPFGRTETLAILPANATDCFQAAGLLKAEPDAETIHWWYEMATFIRSKISDKRAKTGLKGEKLSIQYETTRTGRKPKWVSFESSFAGYDLLSTASSKSDEIRLIEVKSSEKPVDSATFFLSANEWNIASKRFDSYHFHLWSLSKSPILADVSAKEVAKHIPQNQNSGTWESVEIPFSVFFDDTSAEEK